MIIVSVEVKCPRCGDTYYSQLIGAWYSSTKKLDDKCPFCGYKVNGVIKIRQEDKS